MILFRAVHKETGRVFRSSQGKTVFEKKQGVINSMSHAWYKKEDYRIETVQINDELWEELT